MVWSGNGIQASVKPCSCGGVDPDQQLYPFTAAALEPLDSPFPVPAYPPRSWFTERPDWLTPGTKLTVDDEGRIAGYFYDRGQCLVHNAAACPKPSPTFYAAFHQQHVTTDDGESIPVGVIGNVNGHASPYAPVSVAQAHYADPDAQLISCRAYDDEHGGFILGALVPHARYADVALIGRSALSGDWRPMPPAWWQGHNIAAGVVADCEGFDCIGPTLVNRPGLPLIRSFAASAGVPCAVLGGTGGVQLDEREPPMTTKRTTTIVEEGPVAPPGPQPAVVAAPPPPPNAPPKPAADGGGSDGPTLDDVVQVVTELVQRVNALEEAMGAQVQAEAAAIAASVEPLPV